MIKAARIAAVPLWTLQLVSGAKSFRANGLIGSRTLNRLGLHVGRKLAAHGVTGLRRAALAPLVPAELRRAFRRDGYVAIPDFLPAAEFEALRAEASAVAAAAPRKIQEGDTRTELSLVDDAALVGAPHLKRFVRDPRFLGLCNYVGSRLKHPFCQVQVLERDFAANQSDPQKSVHADTFHPTLKGWFFLDDVDPDKGPLNYVPGSHRITRKRLAWEYAQSLKAGSSADEHVAAGSFRAAPEDLDRMGLPQPVAVTVAANTLVLADTVGFHCRGQAHDGRPRRAIYVYMRTNPFNPILGFRSNAWRRLELYVFKKWSGRR
ncbi:MAG TPA: phytanoyl-CoA dioxygenase family protein [Caulobacteraceae bacterium]